MNEESSVSVLTKYYLGDKMKKNEMGDACSRYGRRERCIEGFGEETLGERYHLENLGIDGRILLKWILKSVAGKILTGFIWFRRRTVSIKRVESDDYLKTSSLIRNDHEVCRNSSSSSCQ